MSIVISHWSALQIHALVRTGAIPPLRRSRTTSLGGATSRAAELRASGAIELLGDERPVDVLVGTRSARHASSACEVHACFQPLPAGSFLELDDVLVCSPELAYLQVAASLSSVERMLLAMELCGTYSTMGVGFAYGVDPCANIRRLRTCAGAFRRGCESSGIRNALMWALDGSASPMETVLALVLRLPRTRGGYGIKPPELNARIRLNRRASALCGARNLYCDLLWRDDGLAFEYDSREFHSAAERHGKDATRALALQGMGIQVQSVTHDQLVSIPQMSSLAMIAAKATGKRVRRCSPDMLAKRAPLMDEMLMVAHRPWSSKLAG